MVKKNNTEYQFLHKRHYKVRSNLTTIAASVCIKIASPKIGAGCRLKKPSQLRFFALYPFKITLFSFLLSCCSNNPWATFHTVLQNCVRNAIASYNPPFLKFRKFSVALHLKVQQLFLTSLN